jgi:hypothetical protein
MMNSELTFEVTPIGTGLDIAPANCRLPEQWRPLLLTHT